MYRSLLGHQTSQALCNLLDNKLIIVIENAITQPEKLLVQNGQQDLAAQVRSQLESVLELPLISIPLASELLISLFSSFASFAPSRLNHSDATGNDMKDLIKEVLGVGVIDLLSDVTFETGRTGTIAILESAPKVRDATFKSKTQPEGADG